MRKIYLILVFNLVLIVFFISLGSALCGGCFYEGVCYEIGEELLINDIPIYCDVAGAFSSQKNDGVKCENDFECVNNLCSNGECVNLYKEVESRNELTEKVSSSEKEKCNGVDDDGDGLIDEDFDKDADGYFSKYYCIGYYESRLIDCDDSNPSFTATYLYYRDRDGDGYGTKWVQLESCDSQILSGYSDISGDCFDTDYSPEYLELAKRTFPGADEVCDNMDNDCDGLKDEGFDKDGDGYFDESSCNEYYPSGWSLDCDDDDEGVHPGVIEVCDGKDNDCDGEVDLYNAQALQKFGKFCVDSEWKFIPPEVKRFVGSEDPNQGYSILVVSELSDSSTRSYLDAAFGSGSYSVLKTSPISSKADKFNVYYSLIPAGDYSGRGACSWGLSSIKDVQRFDTIFNKFTWEDGKIYLTVDPSIWPDSSIQISVNCDRFGETDIFARTIGHEFGHKFGYLKDEYVYSGGYGSDSYYNYLNCASSVELNRWDGISNYDGAHYLGCTTPTLYRSTANSIMRDHYNSWSWGPINEYYLNEKLELLFR